MGKGQVESTDHHKAPPPLDWEKGGKYVKTRTPAPWERLDLNGYSNRNVSFQRNTLRRGARIRPVKLRCAVWPDCGRRRTEQLPRFDWRHGVEIRHGQIQQRTQAALVMARSTSKTNVTTTTAGEEPDAPCPQETMMGVHVTRLLIWLHLILSQVKLKKHEDNVENNNNKNN